MIAQVAQVTLLTALVAGAAAFPGALYSQYHAQDELGQYRFGYSGPMASKHEERAGDGTTRGSYSYLDPNGRLQTRSYTADDVNGFRVAASDLTAPVDQPASRYWSPAPRSAMGSAVIYGGHNFYPHQNYFTAPAANPYITENGVRAVPVYAVQGALPVALPAPPALLSRALPGSPQGILPAALQLPSGISSQYHAQDEAGQYSFGYSNNLSTKSETKTSDGVVRGSYSYVDPNGVVQSRSYVADDNGFRVIASDLPQAQP